MIRYSIRPSFQKGCLPHTTRSLGTYLSSAPCLPGRFFSSFVSPHLKYYQNLIRSKIPEEATSVLEECNLFSPDSHWRRNLEIHRQFPPFTHFGVSREIVESVFTRILSYLDIPFVDQETNTVKKEGFFIALETMVHRQDPYAKVYLGGGSIRNLFGFLYSELVHAKEIGEKTPQEILQKMTTGTYVFRDQQAGMLSKLCVLGFGSDLDILIQFSDDFPKEMKNIVIGATRSFIHSFGDRLPDTEIKSAISPYADVKEYLEQTKRGVRQGGSPLDWLAFPVSPKSGARIITPPGHPHLVDQILQGRLPFLPVTNAENADITTARVIRSLLEVPCLTHTLRDEIAWTKQLKIIAHESKEYSPEVAKVFSKAIRNIRSPRAVNQIVESKKGPLTHIRKISQKLSSNSSGYLIPELLEESDIRRREEAYDPGDLRKIGALLPRGKFLEAFTDRGWLYHGTPTILNFFPIIRGAFFVSCSSQGNAAYGRGFYCSPSYNEAISYAKSSGIVIPFRPIDSPQLRILCLSDFQRIFPERYLQIYKEAQERNIDFHEHLNMKYNIDIIINNHVLIQNARALETPRTTEKFLALIEESLLQELESINTVSSWVCFTKKYTTYLMLTNYYCLPIQEKTLEAIRKVPQKLREKDIPIPLSLNSIIIFILEQPDKKSLFGEVSLEILKQLFEKITSYENIAVSKFWSLMQSLFKEDKKMALEFYRSLSHQGNLMKADGSSFPFEDSEFSLEFFEKALNEEERASFISRLVSIINLGNPKNLLYILLEKCLLSEKEWHTLFEKVMSHHNEEPEDLILAFLNKYSPKTHLSLERQKDLCKTALSWDLYFICLNILEKYPPSQEVWEELFKYCIRIPANLDFIKELYNRGVRDQVLQEAFEDLIDKISPYSSTRRRPYSLYSIRPEILRWMLSLNRLPSTSIQSAFDRGALWSISDLIGTGVISKTAQETKLRALLSKKEVDQDAELKLVTISQLVQKLYLPL